MNTKNPLPFVLVITLVLIVVLIFAGCSTVEYNGAKERFRNYTKERFGNNGGEGEEKGGEIPPPYLMEQIKKEGNPFYKQLQTPGWPPNLSESEKVQALYAPMITRPPFYVHQPYIAPCEEGKNGLFSNSKFQIDCDPEVSAKYYANRPIINPDDYHQLLEFLFKNIAEPFEMDTTTLVHSQMFSSGDDYSEIMKFVMNKINGGVSNLKPFVDYAKVDTWGGEQFAFLNEKIYSFTATDTASLPQQTQATLARYGDLDEPTKYVLSFTLYNTRRSVSTDVIANILCPRKGENHLVSINFGTETPNDGGIRPYQWIENGGINLNAQGIPDCNNEPQWIFGNTLENEFFNTKGFHDPNPSNNVIVEGGVPDSLNDVLNGCDQGFIMECGSAQRLHGGSGYPATQIDVIPKYPQQKIWEVKV